MANWTKIEKLKNLSPNQIYWVYDGKKVIQARKLLNGFTRICDDGRDGYDYLENITHVADWLIPNSPDSDILSKPNFGDYVFVEQKRHGAPNEMYLHKVIGRSESNTYVDIPVQSPATEIIHKQVVEVVSCICCGVMETTVRKYKLSDVKIKH